MLVIQRTELSHGGDKRIVISIGRADLFHRFHQPAGRRILIFLRLPVFLVIIQYLFMIPDKLVQILKGILLFLQNAQTAKLLPVMGIYTDELARIFSFTDLNQFRQ